MNMVGFVYIYYIFMDYRNRKTVMIVRILLGLFLVMSGVSGLMVGNDFSKIPAPMVPYMRTLLDTGLFYMIKITELIAGVMLVVGFLPALAALFVAPLCVGILVFHLAVAPAIADMWGGLLLTVLTVYLGYAYWGKYKALFQR